MRKVDVLRLPTPKRVPFTVSCDADGEPFEIELRPLTAIEEIEAGALASECAENWPDGVYIGDGDQLAQVTDRAWLTVCRLYRMQTEKLYSPEEFLAIFHKMPRTSALLFRATMREPEGGDDNDPGKKPGV